MTKITPKSLIAIMAVLASHTTASPVVANVERQLTASSILEETLQTDMNDRAMREVPEALVGTTFTEKELASRQLDGEEGVPTHAPTRHPKPPPKNKKKKKEGEHKTGGGGGGESTRKYSGGGNHSGGGGGGGGGSSGGGGGGGSSSGGGGGGSSGGSSASTGGGGSISISGGSSSGGSSGGGSSSGGSSSGGSSTGGSSSGGSSVSTSSTTKSVISTPADSTDRDTNLPAASSITHGQSKSFASLLTSALAVGFLVAGFVFVKQREYVDRELDPSHNHRLKGSMKNRMVMFNRMMEMQGSRSNDSGDKTVRLAAVGEGLEDFADEDESQQGRGSSNASVGTFKSRASKASTWLSTAARKKLVRQLSKTKSARQMEIHNDVGVDMNDIGVDVYSRAEGDGVISLESMSV